MDHLEKKRPNHREGTKAFVEHCAAMLNAIEHELVGPYVELVINGCQKEYLLRPGRLQRWCDWPSEIGSQKDLDAISCNVAIICRELRRLRPQDDTVAAGIDDCINEWQGMKNASLNHWGEGFGVAALHLQDALRALRHP